MWPETISVDRFLTILSLIIAIFGIAFAFYFYRKSIRTKILAIAYTEPIPLLLTLENITVSYLGTNISSLSRVFILLWNKGTAPIESSDFIAPIEIMSNQQILKLEIHEKDAAVSANFNSQTNSIDIELLRPGGAITLIVQVTDDSYRPDLKIQMKSVEMSALVRGLRAGYPGAFAVLAVICLAFIDGYYLYAHSYIPDPPSLNKFLIGCAAIGGVPFLFGAIVYFLTTKLILRSTSPVAWRFFQVQMSAWQNRIKWNEIKKKIGETTTK
jgi:hypothetical protein